MEKTNEKYRRNQYIRGKNTKPMQTINADYHTHKHIHTQTHKHTQTHTHTQSQHTLTHNTHTYTYTHTLTLTHTHTHTAPPNPPPHPPLPPPRAFWGDSEVSPNGRLFRMDRYFQWKMLKGACGGWRADGSCQAKRLQKNMNHNEHGQNRPTSLRQVMF